MMGGGGSMQGMRNSLNNNNKLLRKKRLFRKERSFFKLKREYLKAAGGELNFKTADKTQLIKIRKKILRQRRNENFLLITISLIVISIASYFISPKLYKQIDVNNNAKIKKDSIDHKRKNDKYLFYISDGDNYLKKNQWHNAIFQYNKAAEIFPNDFDIKYRLGYAYTYRCQNEKKDCKKGAEYVKNLNVDFPDKNEIIELVTILEFENNE